MASPQVVPESEASAWSPVLFPQAQQRDYESNITKNRYRIFVSLPASPPPPSGYPAFYVLDGNAAFPVAALMNRTVERRSALTGVQGAIVIGIGYAGSDDYHTAARARDYTLPFSGYDKRKEGGADQFLNFIEQELQPLISARYPVNPHKQALFGHSFGGLLVLHALFTRTALFSCYLATSPSIWWGRKAVLQAMAAFVQRTPAGGSHNPLLQIAVGSLEDAPAPPTLSAEIRRLHASRLMVAEARSLFQTLNALPDWTGRVVYHELEGENHGSSFYPALSRGLDFFLGEKHD
jgi:predicted alpha/beta superfamily hydrolase